jgi:hypothetical protein
MRRWKAIGSLADPQYFFHCQSIGQIGWHASLQTGESRVSHVEVMSYLNSKGSTEGIVESTYFIISFYLDILY